MFSPYLFIPFVFYVMNESSMKTGLNRSKTSLKQVFDNFFKELKIELDYFSGTKQKY